MICTACKTAADQHLPHDGCDNVGRDYRGCGCEHQPSATGEHETPVKIVRISSDPTLKTA